MSERAKLPIDALRVGHVSLRTIIQRSIRNRGGGVPGRGGNTAHCILYINQHLISTVTKVAPASNTRILALL